MSVISQTERAVAIAIEQAAWWESQGWTPERARSALKRRRSPATGRADWTWPDVVDAVASAWLALP